MHQSDMPLRLAGFIARRFQKYLLAKILLTLAVLIYALELILNNFFNFSIFNLLIEMAQEILPLIIVALLFSLIILLAYSRWSRQKTWKKQIKEISSIFKLKKTTREIRHHYKETEISREQQPCWKGTIEGILVYLDYFSDSIYPPRITIEADTKFKLKDDITVSNRQSQVDPITEKILNSLLRTPPHIYFEELGRKYWISTGEILIAKKVFLDKIIAKELLELDKNNEISIYVRKKNTLVLRTYLFKTADDFKKTIKLLVLIAKKIEKLSK